MLWAFTHTNYNAPMLTYLVMTLLPFSFLLCFVFVFNSSTFVLFLLYILLTQLLSKSCTVRQ